LVFWGGAQFVVNELFYYIFSVPCPYFFLSYHDSNISSIYITACDSSHRNKIIKYKKKVRLLIRQEIACEFLIVDLELRNSHKIVIVTLN
jgi:hypothetical protein